MAAHRRPTTRRKRRRKAGAGRKRLFSAGTTWIRLPLPSPIERRLRARGGPAAIREELLAALREARPEWFDGE